MLAGLLEPRISLAQVGEVAVPPGRVGSGEQGLANGFQAKSAKARARRRSAGRGAARRPVCRIPCRSARKFAIFVRGKDGRSPLGRTGLVVGNRTLRKFWQKQAILKVSLSKCLLPFRLIPPFAVPDLGECQEPGGSA
jgi:hypothetical protein